MALPEHALVPALVGLEVADAQELALLARVAVAGHHPDVPLPLSGLVSAQHPKAGTQVTPGDTVTIRVQEDPDGGNGGRGGSPRHPDEPRPQDPAGVK